MVWYSHLFQNFPQFIVIHTVKGFVAERSYPTPKARGGCWEEQPHIQGAVAAWAPEGLEELFHVQGWEGQR